MRIPTILVCVIALESGLDSVTQAEPGRAAVPPRAGGAAAPTAVFRGTIPATYFDVSPPLRDMIAAGPGVTAEPRAPIEPGVESTQADGPFAQDPVVQDAAGVTAMPAPSLVFNTISNVGFNVNPPSPSADVGRNHYVIMANLRCGIFDRSGTLMTPLFNNNLIWAGFGGACEAQNSGSPMVLYDQLADRWLLSQPTYSGAPYHLCVAVSTTGDPLGSYYRWSFDLGDHFPDAPKFAVWPDAYYVGTREFMTSAGPYLGNGAYALNRADLIAGVATPRVISFLVPPGAMPFNTGDGFQPADLDGSNPPPSGSPGYYVGSMDQGGPYGAPQDALTLWRFKADFDTPALSSFTLASTLLVGAFDSIYPCPGGGRRCIPQPTAAATQYLDILSYRQRILHRLAYRNFGTHEALVCNQSVEAGPSLAGIRWYELRDPGGTPFVHQEGTYAPGLTDGIHRWAGSIAMDNQGNLALGFSASSGVSVFPSIFYTGRLAGDPAGSMSQGEGAFFHGGGFQSTTNNRWGDYSSMNVDPRDDCTFWYVNEYYPVTSATGWMLGVGTFKYPGCTPPVGVEDGGPPPSETRLAPIPAVRGPVELRFTIAGAPARPVRLDVFDVAGRRVRRLMDATLGGGTYHVPWDGTTDAGERLRPGMYRVRLRAGREQDVGSAILLR